MLRTNQVLKFQTYWYRILLSEQHVVVWIDIHDENAMPDYRKTNEIDALILSGDVMLAEDPFLSAVLDTPIQNSRAWEIRQRAWEMIQPLISDLSIYDANRRGRLIVQCARTFNVTKQTLYRHLRRYWQRGMCMNALLPDYNQSGGAGKRRIAKHQTLGRPRSVRTDPSLKITLAIERYFRQAIDSEYIDKEDATMQDAFRKAVRLITAHATETNKNVLPTFRQFQYFYAREYTAPEVAKKRISPIIYAKDIKALRSTSNSEVLGPGTRYQFDATIADIYLVSEHDRSRIVGRPVIYIVIDVFSRMVTGLYVGLESPSWVGAMIALGNTVEDKVTYCQAVGIDITAEVWPTLGLPDAILADRAEMLGLHVEVLIEAFAVRIENAPAYRGDAKGIVERYFKTLQANFKPYVDGVVTGDIGIRRGGVDYRLDATLTLSEFRKIIIHCVLWHNRHHVLVDYDRDSDMPTDLPSIPLKLWQWGVVNRTGRLRQYPEDIVKVNLLPHKTATVSELGVKLFGAYYTGMEVVKLGWFDRISGHRPASVLVAYDPRDANRIYIRPDGKKSAYWICELNDQSRRFRGMTFWDLWQLSMAERKTNANAASTGLVERCELDATIESITESARQQRPDLSHLTKAERLGSIRDNKQAEKRLERSTSVLMPPSAKQTTPATVTQLHPRQETNFQYPTLVDQLFTEDDDA